MSVRSLVDLLEESVGRHPGKTAVLIPGGASLDYAQLGELSDRMRDRLVCLGVRPGDRVGMRLHKSVDGIATIFGILKAGAAYVPVDAESPAARGAYILDNCAVKAVVTEKGLEAEIVRELTAIGATPPVLALDVTREQALSSLLDELQQSAPAPRVANASPAADDIAYILYTSGSTGLPKGVVLSHRNALSFIDWCSEVFEPQASDRFSSHAPFHFDLSILDIYVPLKHGATLVLIGEALGKDPIKLAQVISAEQISVWYSTPSILSLLANYGKLAEVRLLEAAHGVLRGRGVSDSAVPRIARAVARAALLQSLWPHRDQCLHLVRSAVGRSGRRHADVSHRHDLSAESRQGGRRARRHGAFRQRGRAGRAWSECHERLLEPSRTQCDRLSQRRSRAASGTAPATSSPSTRAWDIAT